MDAEDIILPQFSLPSPGRFFSRPRQRRDYFAVKDEDPRLRWRKVEEGFASEVRCRLILRLSGQLFALLRQLIESTVQMWRDWKRAAPISIRVVFLFFPLSPLFPSEQNHSAIRANFIAIFGINRRDRRLPEMGVGRRRDRNLSVRQDCRTGRSYLFGLAMKNVQLTLPRFQFNPRRPN